MGIFGIIESKVNLIIGHLNAAAVSPQVSALKSAMIAYLTVWILFRGYMVLAGKSQEPMKDLLFDLAIKATIIMVVFSPTWITLISNAIDGMNSWASGSTSLYTRMDDIVNSLGELIKIVWKKDDSYVPLIGATTILMIVSGFVVFSVFAIWIMVSTTLILKILIMLSPIMIASSFYGWIKDIFTQWIRLIIANTLTVLLVGIFLNAIDGMYKGLIDNAKTTMSDSNLIISGLGILIFSLIIALAIYMAKGIAQQLASVSIENLPGQALRDARDWKDRREQRSFYKGRK